MENKMCLNVNRSAERVAWVDTFRAIMIFFIVVSHALSDESMARCYVKLYVCSVHVPAFFFISGFLFRAKESSFLKFAGYKVKTLMIPYYVFAVASIMIFLLVGTVAADKLDLAIKSTDLLPNLAGMLYANGGIGYMKWNTPMWFLPCLFITLLMFYFLEKCVISKARHRNFAIAGLFVVFVALGFANFYIFRISKLPFGLETAVYLMPFFIAGYWFRSNQGKMQIKKTSKIAVCVATLLAGGLLVAYTGRQIDYISSAYRNMFLFFTSAFLTIAGFVLLTQLISITKLSYVGKNTLAILVMHKFIVMFMQMILAKRMNSNLFVGVGIGLVISVISCAGSLFAGQIIKKIIPWALGCKRTDSR